MTQSFTVSSARHVDECSALPDQPNPPAGGDHYGVWAAYLTYDFPIAHGFSIHSMEHGAVVFSYNCPEGCDDEVQQAQALIDALPEDPLCYGTGSKRRAILLPDPTLDVRWGVSAWGHHLRAECVDSQAFTNFYTEHYAQTAENFCAWGVNFTSSPCP